MLSLSTTKTGCQQFVMWVTDEGHQDNDVRCEPGRYERRQDANNDEYYVYIPGDLCNFVSNYENLIRIVQSNIRTNVSI